jgi:hypothetical protein
MATGRVPLRRNDQLRIPVFLTLVRENLFEIAAPVVGVCGASEPRLSIGYSHSGMRPIKVPASLPTGRP